MLRCRLLTEHARNLRNQSRTRDLFSASMGQEAIATGFVIDLRPQDTIVLAPHDSIAGMVKGVALSDIVARLYARSSSAGGWTTNILGPGSGLSSYLDEQLQAASRVALANKQQNDNNVVVAFNSRTAATSASVEGYWHEALKFATRRRLPIVFVVENNPWAGAHARNGNVDLTPKTQREGLTSITVDGNDVVAVYRVAYESLERVRDGGGPVLVEGKTYRPVGQALLGTERDPLTHMERYLKAKRLFTARWKNQLIHRFSRELDAAVQELGVPPTRYLRASQAAAND
jgi:TPP-dependent pyruvate/acetoin dehydrogenase alpha subunit